MRDLLKIFILGCAVVFSTACSDDDSDNGNSGGLTNPVTGIALSNVSGTDIILNDIGETFTAQVTATPANAEDIEKYYYDFTSSDTHIFTVDNNGIVTATGAGQATLTVIPKNNKTIAAKYNVKVVGIPVTSITLSDAYKNLSYILDNNTVNLDMTSPSLVTISPADASIKELKFTTSDYNVVEITSNGYARVIGPGTAIIRVEATDGSGVYDECVVDAKYWDYRLLNRTSWSAIDSSPTIEVAESDFTAGGPAYAIDNDQLGTAVGLLKAAATGGPSDGILYFTIDMGEAKDFNYFTISGMWAGSTLNSYVKINRLSLYGSNDGTTFTDIQTNMTISTSLYDVTAALNATHKYRYIKAAVNPYQTSTSRASYVIVKDFKLGLRVLLPE